jgi:hypothetical protein
VTWAPERLTRELFVALMLSVCPSGRTCRFAPFKVHPSGVSPGWTVADWPGVSVAAWEEVALNARVAVMASERALRTVKYM